jgi:hypothetical protein
MTGFEILSLLLASLSLIWNYHQDRRIRKSEKAIKGKIWWSERKNET